MNEGMKDFKNWTEVTKGIYRYVIHAGACYEIHLIHWDYGTPILTAKASLHISGDWVIGNSCLLPENSVQNCINAAIEYYETNITNTSE